jgi:hypothetical protein
MAGDRKPFLFLQTPFKEGNARFSPDDVSSRMFRTIKGETKSMSRSFLSRVEVADIEQWRIWCDMEEGWTRTILCFRRRKLMSVPTRTGSAFEAGVPMPF